MGDLYQAVVMAESSGNPRAQSARGARGLMQITEPALTDYNARFGTKWTMDDMFVPEKNMSVGKWYLGTEVPRQLRYYRLPDSVTNRLWGYNAGVGSVKGGVMPKETKLYVERVREQLGRK